MLMLFLIAMPLKYAFGNAMLIPSFGMFHGVAFMAYLLVMVPAFLANRIGVMGWLRAIVASLVPFGTFVNDASLKKQIAVQVQTSA